jgi:hypothetical protein
VQVISEPSTAERTKPVASPMAAGFDVAVADSRIEIALPDGMSIRVGHEIGLVKLRRVMPVLRG